MHNALYKYKHKATICMLYFFIDVPPPYIPTPNQLLGYSAVDVPHDTLCKKFEYAYSIYVTYIHVINYVYMYT